MLGRTVCHNLLSVFFIASIQQETAAQKVAVDFTELIQDFGGIRFGDIKDFADLFGNTFIGENPKSPVLSFESRWGLIQAELGEQLNNRDSARLSQSLQVLAKTLATQISSYSSQNQTEFTKDERSDFVDVSMKSIDLLLSSSPDWFDYSSSKTIDDAFILANALGFGHQTCLESRFGNLAEGTDVIVSSSCNLESESLEGKVFGLQPGGMIILRTNKGDFCLAFKSKNGNLRAFHHLGFYAVDSPQCTKSNHPISLRQSHDSTWALYDGSDMLCVRAGLNLFNTTNLNVIVTPRRMRCLNRNFLSFSTRLPVLINPVATSSSTSNASTSTSVVPLSSKSISPYRTYQELGVQLAYFSTFVSIHLSSFVELAKHGSLAKDAHVKLQRKVVEYRDWLARVLPIYRDYRSFAGELAADRLLTVNNALLDTLGSYKLK